MGKEKLRLYCGTIQKLYPRGPPSIPYIEYTVAANQKEARKEFENKYISLREGAIRRIRIEEVNVRGYRIHLEKMVK